jgi:erythromycin esterase-like protein
MSDAEAIREIAQPLTGSPNDYDALLGLITHARFVLLGEASHGTHEFILSARRLRSALGFPPFSHLDVAQHCGGRPFTV